MSSDSTRRERRLRRRHGLQDVRGSLLFSHRCRVLNLSAGGLAVESPTPLAPGRSYTLKIEHDDGTIPLSGTVAWCRLRGNRKTEEGDSVPVYVAGIELDDEVAAKGVEVLPLLEEHGVIQLERRLPGHLVPRTGEERGKTQRDPPATVVVRRVSRSGLVVDAPFFPEPDDLVDLWIGLEEGGLPLTGRVREVRPASPREGQAWAELTLEYADMSPDDRRRLDRLIRDELLEIAPPEED